MLIYGFGGELLYVREIREKSRARGETFGEGYDRWGGRCVKVGMRYNMYRG
jgi:hypothetical protein